MPVYLEKIILEITLLVVLQEQELVIWVRNSEVELKVWSIQDSNLPQLVFYSFHALSIWKIVDAEYLVKGLPTSLEV